MITRRLALTTALAGAATTALAQQGGGKKGGDDPFADNSTSGGGFNITGNYRVEGLNPNGSAYNGVVRIDQQDNRVSIAWNVGGQAYSGTGIIEGRIVAIDWGADSPVVYVVMPDGQLHGTWNDGLALERLTPN
ncbi:MAG: hypothetical protein AAF748_08650 [Pseudomonadota bacterium]